MIKNAENVQTDRCGNIRRQYCLAKGSGKEIKCKRLRITIKRMCNRKCKIIPVKIRANRIVRNGLRKSLLVIPGKHAIDSI
jgi:hypothetical protein